MRGIQVRFEYHGLPITDLVPVFSLSIHPSSIFAELRFYYSFLRPRIKIIARLIAHQNEYRSEVEIPTARRSSTSAQRRRLSSRAGANDFSITGKSVWYGTRLPKVLA
jgi:hypothetical protein